MGRTETGRLSGNEQGNSPYCPSVEPGICEPEYGYEILVSESSDYRCMFRTHETDWQRGYQIQAFFCPDSVDTYLGDTRMFPD